MSLPAAQNPVCARASFGQLGACTMSRQGPCVLPRPPCQPRQPGQPGKSGRALP
jgi:hypothetical protein